jgi:hypothetical protein
MGMSLEAAKPLLEQNLKNDFSKIIKDAFEKALYEAFKAQTDDTDGLNSSGPQSEDDVKKRMDNKYKNASKKFAEVANDNISGDLAKQITARVHDYVKEMMITVNNAPVLPTVVSPMGPCTGTLTILPTSFQIS